MDKIDSSPNKGEKKTERLDIRVSHQKKQAFSEACEDQGDTPSNAIRRFIASYIRRAKRDDFGAMARKFSWSKIATVSLGIVATGVGTLWLLGYATQTKDTRAADKVFKIYDENANGLIELGEIAPNDNHLHRVLNIDGQPGISRAEFIGKATMIWRFVDPDNFEIIQNENGRFIQKSITLSRVSVPHDDKTKAALRDPNAKKFIMVDGKPVEYKGKETILENAGSIGFDFQTIRKYGGLPDTSAEKLRKYNMKIVRFDLRDPDTLELTVLEQQSHAQRAKSITTFQRSVTWVEGRATPEHVMGMGRDKAVLSVPRDQPNP